MSSMNASNDPGEAIKVYVRVRQLLGREEVNKIEWKVDDERSISSKNGAKNYQFDRVFKPGDNNEAVYNELNENKLIDSAMNGFNATIFAYGQTASGKTHTMMGSKNEKGIIQNAIDEIFDFIAIEEERQFQIQVSYMEIYNEIVTDLLGTSKNRKSDGLKLRGPDEEGEFTVENLEEKLIVKKEEVLQLIEEGHKVRKTGKTNMNEHSSRSHTIFRIKIASKDIEDEENERYIWSYLNLVDLAGSERASQTGATGERLTEGININKSLMTLGKVIRTLSEGESAGMPPFRESKLTKILKSSLGGNTKTAIICTVTPAEKDQTQSTLGFAKSAKNIVQHARINEKFKNPQAYEKKIAELEAQLIEEMQKGKQNDLNEVMKKENDELQQKLEQLKQDQLKQKEEYEKLDNLFKTRQSQWANDAKWNDVNSLLHQQQADPNKIKTDRRMTIAFAPQAGRSLRRMSMWGVKKVQAKKDAENSKNDLSDMELMSPLIPSRPPIPPKPIVSTTPDLVFASPSPRRRSHVSDRRGKRVQFQPIEEEEVFEEFKSPKEDTSDSSSIVDQAELERLLGSGIIELSDIKHTIRGLQAKLERDADTRASLEKKIEILQKSPDKAQDKSNTTLDLTAADDSKIELMMKISELEEQLTNAKHHEDLKVKDIEAKHDEKMQEIQKQISDLTTENQEHLDLMDFVKCEKEELANENEELKSKLKQLNVNLNNMESENKQLQENTHSLSNEMTEMKSNIEQLADLRTSNEKLKEELVQLKSESTSKLSSLTQKVQEVEDEREDLKEKFYCADAQSESLKADLKTKQVNLDQLKQNLKTAQCEVDNKLTEIQQLKNEVDILQNSKKDVLNTEQSKTNAFQATIDMLQGQLGAQEAKIYDLNNELGTVQKHYDEQCQGNDDLKGQLADLLSQLKDTQQQKGNSDAEVIDLKRQAQSHQETLGKLHSEREDLMLKLQAGEGTNAALQQLQDQNESLASQFMRMSNEKDEIIGKQKNDIDNLHGSLNESQRTVSNLNEKVSKLESQKTEILSTSENMQKDLAIMSEKLQNKTEEYIRQEAQAKMDSEAKNEAVAKLKMATNECQTLNSKISDLQEEKIKLDTKCNSLTTDLEESKKKTQKLEAKIHQDKSMIDELQSAKSATESKCQEVETMLTGIKQQVEEQRQVNSTLKAEKDDIQQVLKKTQVDLDTQHENCHKLEMNLEGKVKTLQDLSAQMNQREETLSQLKDKDTLLQQKIALIEELENKIKDIEEQNAYFENDLQTELAKAREQKEKSQFNNDALENHIKKLEAKISDMEDSVSFVEIDLRDKLSKEIKEKELLQEYATSLKSSMEAVQDVQDKYNQLVIDNEELEIQLKEMENCDNQAYVKTLKEKNAQQTIELASLKVEKVRTEGEQQKIMKRLTSELDGEKGQVKRLKDEIRRIQRQSQQLDSTYVASSRPPLQDKPVETVCSNCQNQLNNIPAATTANKKLDDDAFMKYDTSKEVGAFSTGCGALKEVYLEQAKRKVSFYEKELTRVQRKKDIEVKHYHETAIKWKGRTLDLQKKIEHCTQCVTHIEKYS